MKELVALVMMLSLATFSVVGCGSRAPDNAQQGTQQNTQQPQNNAQKPAAAKPAENKPATDIPVK